MKHHRIYAAPLDPALSRTEITTTGEDFFLFLLIFGDATLDDMSVTASYSGPSAFWTTYDTRCRVRLQAGTRGHLLRCPFSVVQAALPTGMVAGFVQRATASTFGTSLVDDDRLRQIRNLMDVMESQTPRANPLASAVEQNVLAGLICLMLQNSTEIESDKTVLPRRVVQEFIRLVELHLNDHWTVERYAREIGISRDHLQLVLRRQANVSPHEYIQQKMTDAAQSLLANTDLTVTEVAYRLGFSDAAYFNRFFRRRSGVPPGEFRRTEERLRKRIEPSPEFSSWP